MCKGKNEDSLRQFLSLRIPEGLYIDYKEGLSGTSEKKDAKREFLKDITALANAAGGHIFIGVKEPRDSLSIDNQLVGLDSGESLAQDLERLASTSIDPRVPGLRIVHVPLQNNKSCLLVHIPPSFSRPHMVSHMGHRSFYIRHSESSFPMTTHEVREAVLASASAEARARLYLQRRVAEVRNTLEDHKPAIFIQAMPMMSLESAWDILDTNYENVLRGGTRRGKFQYYYDLASDTAPRPTIDGLLGRDQRTDPTWETEIHRNGYVSVCFTGIQVEKVGDADRYTLHSGYCGLFKSFCHLLVEVWSVSGTDLPYGISSVCLNAKGTCLFIHGAWPKFSEPYRKQEIVWPEHVRLTGQNPMEIADAMCTEMFNAFGFKQVAD